MTEHFSDSTKKMDFIRREQMHKANRDEWQGVYGFVDCDIFEDNENMIDRVPAADVVEVVRCKDCINWNGNDCITMFGLYAPRPDDYCSRGEKNSG